MNSTNALYLRQHLGALIQQVVTTKLPLIIEKDRRPSVVLIPYEEYQKRFVDLEADNKRADLIEQILQSKLKLPKGKTSLDLLKEASKE